jgi:hypothetical protein
MRFNQQNVQKLSCAIEQTTVLKTVTKSNINKLQKLKTYQALNILGYKNSLLIGIKSLTNERKEINKLCSCKWIDVLIVECDTDINVAHTVLDNLQQSADCVQGLDISYDNMAEHLVQILQKYQ